MQTSQLSGNSRLRNTCAVATAYAFFLWAPTTAYCGYGPELRLWALANVWAIPPELGGSNGLLKKISGDTVILEKPDGETVRVESYPGFDGTHWAFNDGKYRTTGTLVALSEATVSIEVHGVLGSGDTRFFEIQIPIALLDAKDQAYCRDYANLPRVNSSRMPFEINDVRSEVQQLRNTDMLFSEIEKLIQSEKVSQKMRGLKYIEFGVLPSNTKKATELLALLRKNEPPWVVRKEVARLLGLTKDFGVEPWLQEISQDDDFDVRCAARESLKAIGPVPTEFLQKRKLEENKHLPDEVEFRVLVDFPEDFTGRHVLVTGVELQKTSRWKRYKELGLYLLAVSKDEKSNEVVGGFVPDRINFVLSDHWGKSLAILDDSLRISLKVFVSKTKANGVDYFTGRIYEIQCIPTTEELKSEIRTRAEAAAFGGDATREQFKRWFNSLEKKLVDEQFR